MLRLRVNSKVQRQNRRWADILLWSPWIHGRRRDVEVSLMPATRRLALWTSGPSPLHDTAEIVQITWLNS